MTCYVAIWDLLISCSLLLWRFMYTVICQQSVPIYCQVVIHGMACWTTHLPFVGHLTYFQFWLLPKHTNKTVINFCVQIFLCVWENKFRFLWNKCQSAITGPYGGCTFSLLRNCQIVSQSSWTILHSLSQCTRHPTSLTAFSVAIILYFNHADGVWWYLTVVYTFACS